MSGDDPVGNSLKVRTEAFLDEFFSKGQELVRELIEENMRLRAELAARTSGEEAEIGLSAGLVARLVERVAALEAECAQIRSIAGNVQHADGDYRARLEDLEREHYHLAVMYVAETQFQSAENLEAVLRDIIELLMNFVGVGSLTIYGVDEERETAFPMMRSDGDLSSIDEERLDEDGPFGRMLRRRRAWRSGDPLEATDAALMHLPLYSKTRMTGAVRLEKFLKQKDAFVEADLPILALVSERGGAAIETAWIRAHAEEAPLARRALEDLVWA
jgi:hypothetical protein